VARARFQASYAGIGEMINAPRMVTEMRRRAENVAARASATARRGETGQYAAGFRVESGTHGGSNNDRAYGRVVNDDEGAVYEEFGTSRQGARHTLRTALFEAAGD
jgi:hypothetical protein